MTIIINPGTGPVENANETDAELNIQIFVKDLQRRGVPIYKHEKVDIEPDDGRYMYYLYVAETDRIIEIEMPGIDKDEVRYLGEEDQNMWNFPRLYVDGSSWVWDFALNAVENIVFPEEE